MLLVHLHFRSAALRLSILLSFLILFLQNISRADPKLPLHSNKWTVAVVYHIVNGQNAYTGSVLNLRVPSSWTTDIFGQPPTHTRFVPPTIDYEAWLARDGQTLGIWYCSKTQQAGYIYKDGTYLPPHPDNAWVKTIISRARSISKNYNLLVITHLITKEYSLSATSLDELVRQSDLVVIGRNVALMRMQHTPVERQGSFQHSVFLFSIEQYLKNDKPEISGYAMPQVIKIWQDSGILPWQEDSSHGIGDVSWEFPLLNVGDRYILFLKAFDIESIGYVTATVDGITGMQAEFDEYYPLSYVGNYSFEHGKVQGYGTHISFDTGTQLEGLSEGAAVAAIAESLKQPPIKVFIPTLGRKTGK